MKRKSNPNKPLSSYIDLAVTSLMCNIETGSYGRRGWSPDPSCGVLKAFSRGSWNALFMCGFECFVL